MSTWIMAPAAESIVAMSSIHCACGNVADWWQSSTFTHYNTFTYNNMTLTKSYKIYQYAVLYKFNLCHLCLWQPLA